MTLLRRPRPSVLAALAIPGIIAPIVLSDVARAADKSAPAITVDNAWFANMPNNGPTYGYFRITNHGDDPKLITGYSAPVCSSLKLEEAHGGGTNGKAQVTMTVAGKTRLVFSRGGYHLVCERGNTTLTPGQTVPVKIALEGGPVLQVNFEVRTFPH